MNPICRMETGKHREPTSNGMMLKRTAIANSKKLERGREVSKMCSCCGKDGKRKNLYLTEYEAGVVANERRFVTGITMHVYRCPEGGGWHITSNQRQW